MRHSALNRGVMLDWLQVSIETASMLPTDSEIMDRFGFTSPEQARTLLADLADRGDITIRWQGEMRIIALGREKARMASGGDRLVPSVRMADPEVDAAFTKIKAIITRSASAPAAAENAKAASALLGQVAKAKRTPSPIVAVAPPAAEVALPAPIVATSPPSVASPAKSPPPPSRAAAPRKAVTVNIPAPVFDELARRAGADEMMPGTLAAQIVIAAMSGPGKLLVPAAGFRAAQVAGASVHDFASMLIRRGLQAHLEETGVAA